MHDSRNFYIDGEWIAPASAQAIDVVDPSTEEIVGQISDGSPADVDRAVEAACRAGETFGLTPPEERIELLQAILDAFHEREEDIVEAMVAETGGTGRPEGISRGFFVKPTVFGAVSNDMTIARQEIFGPVLSILPYSSDEEAIVIANDSSYGLAAYIQSTDTERARRVAKQLKVGMVHINHPPADRGAPFGGVKQSGNGREWGEWGLSEYLELKAVVGWGQP
ncbi:MAG: aldehyde dehydrogenase family protein [Nitratireductor sp.]|nr:aldehyde dehydrogenase family protein [Nitratireductor sp.]